MKKIMNPYIDMSQKLTEWRCFKCGKNNIRVCGFHLHRCGVHICNGKEEHVFNPYEKVSFLK